MIGVYLLCFPNCEKPYIGQSEDIGTRYAQHIRKLKQNKGARKVQKAYDQYGLPSLVILEFCTIEELNEKESKYIKEFNSIKRGLNTVNVTTSTLPKNTLLYNDLYQNIETIDRIKFACIYRKYKTQSNYFRKQERKRRNIEKANIRTLETAYDIPYPEVSYEFKRFQHISIFEELCPKESNKI